MGIEAEFQKDISAIPSYRGSRHHQAYRVEPVLATTLEANIDAEMSKIGNALVNSIICFDNLRFLVTSIDGFAHIKGADNCSNQSTWISKEVFAVIHQKSEKGNTFYELSIIVHGCIEFLAVGGLIIMQNQPVNAFLGSSIKPLRNANVIDGEKRTTDVFVRMEKQKIVCTERLLRQYYKKQAHSTGFWVRADQPTGCIQPFFDRFYSSTLPIDDS
ncbi:hypothetical protein V8B55DRAFT_1490377 [Mucor lusitanicus]|uniref:Uncharacterized protein n=1 Tax=Mucor circinelloides f. lusitanicus TaxID=29924 RepID=A0A8H4BP53_MUCCL|nr:hypothetical protein FB192DRAFT_1363476 [Mucor lusitanicus]